MKDGLMLLKSHSSLLKANYLQNRWLMKFKAYTSVLCDVFLLMFISCRSQQYCVEHEADVEIPGQDAMSEETLHYSLPRLPHHLPPLPEPLH